MTVVLVEVKLQPLFELFHGLASQLKRYEVHDNVDKYGTSDF